MSDLTTTRVIDLDEIQRLIDPYTNQPTFSLERPRNRVYVDATLMSRATGQQAEQRLAMVAAGNEAIEALENAGYEPAAAPQIDVHGLDVTELGSEACQYVVHATLKLELLGKKHRDRR